MKFKQKIPRVEQVEGQICSGCNHAISNHYVMIDTKDKSYTQAKLHSCTKCKSKVCAW